MTDASHTFEGGCHCGAVRFRVRTSKLEAIDCNCSICTKKGILHLIATKEELTLLRGEDTLAVYTFNTHTAKHMFCRVCGVHPFYVPRSHPDGWDVNVRCLDGDAPSKFTVTPFDGRRWEENVAAIQ